ncbi:MAG: ArsR family transcriptional regulator [Candidatus Thermoplasmatota archaeon]|nr:ArsR family transcriptional regulator [Candidatus Thermoplasmatota archaeon]
MTQNRYEILSDLFRNPTKFRIIMLLTEQERMTVTQMSKVIKVSKSNLYHFISQMVQQGLVLEPEVIPKKNYVEKFYRLNEDMFRAEDPKEWEKILLGATNNEIKEVVSSVLMGYSMTLSFIADRIANSDDSEGENLRKWLIEQTPYTLTYSVMSKKTTTKVKPILRQLRQALIESGEDGGSTFNTSVSRLLVVFLPMLGNPI